MKDKKKKKHITQILPSPKNPTQKQTKNMTRKTAILPKYYHENKHITTHNKEEKTCKKRSHYP